MANKTISEDSMTVWMQSNAGLPLRDYCEWLRAEREMPREQITQALMKLSDFVEKYAHLLPAPDTEGDT